MGLVLEIRKALDIDDLHGKIENYDLVLTVDAPLADALNNRLKDSRLGVFSITPKRLVYGENSNREIGDKKELFIKIIQETELSWKQAFYHLENILSCWENTGELREILGCDRYSGDNTRKVINIIEKTPNIYSAMENFQPLEGRTTAVIAPYQFTELDKKVLPEDYDVIHIFEDETRALPRFKIFGTTTDILQTIRKNVSKGNAADVAIVVSPESEYPSLLQSLFKSESVPFMLRTDFAQDEDLRTLLWILKTGLSEERLRLRDIQPILRSVDIEVSSENNLGFLNDLDIDELAEVKRLIVEVKNSTFGEVIKRYQTMVGREIDNVRENLEEIDILEDGVSEESVNRLEYYLDTFDIEVESSERGVLLASAKSSSFIDRPIVFYLGMDSKWEHDLFEKPWIDYQAVDRKHLSNFELLLQNGEQQHFLVRESEIGERITPCLYFDEILEEEFDSFGELSHRKYEGPLDEERGEGFETEDYGVEVEEVEMISQSDLNRLVRCPREYFFSRLIPIEDNKYLKRGSLFHDFAEFFVNYPEFVLDSGLQKFADLMLEGMKPFVDDFRLITLRTEIMKGLENIVEFLEKGELEEMSLDDYMEKSWKNYFSPYFEKPMESNISETWFENYDLGAKGKVDLVMSDNHLVDHKSGRLKSERSVVKSSNVKLFEENPNFQPILYLTHHRENRPGMKLYFTFFHFLDNVDDLISGESNLEENLVTITYYPNTFGQQLPEKETFEFLVEGVSENNDRRKTLEQMGYSRFREFFEEHDLPHEFDKDKLLSSQLTHDFIIFAQDLAGEYRYIEKGCRSALKKLVDFRRANYFREDLDLFQEFLKEQLEELNRYKGEGFPIGDADLDQLDNRDLIIGNEYGT